jgi:hypothetical protein
MLLLLKFEIRRDFRGSSQNQVGGISDKQGHGHFRTNERGRDPSRSHHQQSEHS